MALMKTAADYGRYRLFAELFFLAAAALLLANTRRTRIIVPTLLLLLLGQRWLGESETFGTYPAALAFPPISMLEPLRHIREPFRVIGRGGAFPPAMNTFYGLEDPRGYEALTLDPFQRTWKLWCVRNGTWFNRVDDLTRPFVSFLNVRFAIQSDTLPVPPGWHPVGAQKGALLLENEHVLDRIFVPRRVFVSSGSTEEIVDRMAAVSDFRDLAFISARAPILEGQNGPGEIVVRAHSLGGFYAFDAHMQSGGFVLVSESAWKGWRGYVDDRRVRLRRANAAFLAVFVPAGHHAVRLRYLPRSFVIGRMITFATMFAIALWIAVHRIRRAPR
jgi:hypothetical protein